MSAVDDVATVASAVTGLLGGVAGLINAARGGRRTGRDPGRQRDSRPRAAGRSSPSKPDRTDWTAAWYGGLALVMALILVLFVNASGDTVDRVPMTLMKFGVGLPAAFAVYFAVLGLYQDVTRQQRHRLVSAGTGLLAAVGAVVSMWIVSAPAPSVLP